MPPSSTICPSSIDGLTSEQIQRFDTDGYIILPEYLDQPTCASLLSSIDSLLQEFPLDTHPMTKFSTGETSNHVGDDYFLNSGDKHRAINKIGHALHTQIPAFSSISHAGPIGSFNAKIASQLGFKDPRLLQSMVICKQPEIGGAVPPHQDSTFLYTNRPSAVGFWIALEDATRENGCLSFARGSHRRAPVRQRFVRTQQSGKGEGTTFERIDSTNGTEENMWPRGFQNDENTAKKVSENDIKQERYELAEVKAGTLVLIHGSLLHKSEKNLSQKGRMIYTFHVIEGEEEYDHRNWLQIPDGPAAFTKLDGKSLRVVAS